MYGGRITIRYQCRFVDTPRRTFRPFADSVVRSLLLDCLDVKIELNRICDNRDPGNGFVVRNAEFAKAESTAGCQTEALIAKLVYSTAFELGIEGDRAGYPRMLISPVTRNPQYRRARWLTC